MRCALLSLTIGMGVTAVSGSLAAAQQKSAAAVQLKDHGATSCFVTTYPSYQPGDVSATCPTTAVTGGSAAAAVTIEGGTGTVIENFSQTGDPGSADIFLGASFDRIVPLAIQGYTRPDEDVVFRFLTTLSGGWLDGTGAVSNLTTFFMSNQNSALLTTVLAANGSVTTTSNGITLTAEGLTTSIPLAAYQTSSNGYDFWVGTLLGVFGDQNPGTSFSIAQSFTLSSVEVVNRSTGARTTLGTDAAGNYLYVGTVAAPEPTSLMLLASGVVGLCCVGRRRIAHVI